MKTKQFYKKLFSLLICLSVLLSCFPVAAQNTAIGGQILNIVEDSKKADPSTLDGWKQYFGPEKMDTEFAGAVWTDKSVFAENTNSLPGVTLTDSNNFLVALSAIASNLSITGHTSAPTDTMLVLDLSGSMVDGTYEVGTIRRGNNNYTTVNGIDMSLINAMVEATNETIDKLMKQNTNNRVGVVLYSGNTNSNNDATPSTATVVLPLGRYTGIDGEYLSVDTTWSTEPLYRYVSSWFNGRYEATGETATYVATGTEINVSVKNGLEKEDGSSVVDSSKEAVGGTYIQNGLYKAMQEFMDVEDTVVPENRPQAGAERLPVIVLMSDGAPTIATTNYTQVGNSDTGNGTSTTDRITFLTQMTAAYVRGRVAAKYQENENDDKDVLFLTLGLGTENSSAATNTLYPTGSNNTLRGYWNSYLGTTAGSNATIISGNNGLRVYRDAAVEAMNYVDKYFYANNADGLMQSFEDIVSEIWLKAENYTTLVEGGNADFSGYVTFEDEIGEMMEVTNVGGILLGNTLYSGMELAKGINSGNLGSVDAPTAKGDELVTTVKERIPGTSTSQAQRLINNAYNDEQLYYTNDNNWSNYIGWYADADGNFVGFWDKESGYTGAPTGAVYANKSYGYLGENGDSDMMHVVVMVRTELATLHQTVMFKIPAALLPTVQYRITLEENSPSQVKEFLREDAQPMRLAFEVGLRSDINSVNLEQKIAEHIARGGHVHRNDDGTVDFYTNEWAIGNDTNKNGIPDPEEVENAVVTHSHFHPALDNTRFYYTEDTVIYSGNDSVVTGSTRPTDTDNDSDNGTGYYYHRYIYTENGREIVNTPIAATTIENDAKYDSANNYWYIPEGTMYHNLALFKTDKEPNRTETLGYSFFPAIFENVSKQDVYTFLGNNGTFTVAPATGITLRKEIQGTIANTSNYTFDITLSDIPSGSDVDLLLTDANGNELTGVTMSEYENNRFTVTMPADVTAYISGIPVGTTVKIAEIIGGDYKVVDIKVNGQTQSVDGPATAVVPQYSADEDEMVPNVNQMVPVVITNAPNIYGSLVISKDVNYPQGFVPGTAHNEKIFTINVEFTGDISDIAAPQGVTRNGNTFTLMLKDGQSATFTNIREGVTYTVTEDDLPAGYELEALRYSDNNHKIEGNDIDEAHVVNNYTLQPVNPNVKIQGDKTLVTNDSSWNGETFTVELLRINNFADEEPVPTGLTATMSEDDPHYEIDLGSIEFTAAGTYYFRAVEVIPEKRNENIAYDSNFGLFSITVGDADADGNLEIQNVNAYQSTQIIDDSNGWVLEKNFTNFVTTDRIYLDIQKNVEDADTKQPVNNHLGDITFGLFTDMSNAIPTYYALTNTLGEATIMIPVTKEVIEDEGVDGKLTYFMREIAPAVENRVVGMKYDESWIYAVEIRWDDEQNEAIVQYAPIENNQIGTYVDYNETFTFEHTNTYESNVSVDFDLTGRKTLNGRDELGGRTFSFSLYESTAAFVKGDLIRTVNNNGNTISFNDVSFKAPGIYYLVAKENDTNEYGGVTNDATEYHITVEVEKFVDTDGTTRLRVVDGYPTVVAYGTADNVGVNGLNFNNIYTVTGSGNVTFKGLKKLDGRTLIAGEFAFGLYYDEKCENLKETVKNNADGTFAFSTIPYTVADLGENYAVKTYTYYVKEIIPDDAVLNTETGKYEHKGVSYDSTVHTVTVTVDHKDGALTVTPSANAVNLLLENSYKAKSVDIGVGRILKGQKVLSGDWSKVENKNFTFNLFEADSNFVITNQTPVDTEVVNGNKTFFMGPDPYEDGDEGFHYYVLKEEIPENRAGGVHYDAGEYHITVNITDPGDGQLVATLSMYRPGTGNTEFALFTNTYTVEPITVTLEGKKLYKNSITNEDVEMQEGMFNFLVLEGNDLENATLAATGYNLADGSIEFAPIHYTKAGTHTYKVVEFAGDAEYVTYDTDTVFTVTVNVVDNGNGKLIATVDYNDTDVIFNNKYNTKPAEYTVEIQKLYEGDDMKEFDFELAVDGEKKQTKQNDENGVVKFDTVYFDTVGTYEVKISEKVNILWGLIRWDKNVYTVKLHVEDDGEGQLFINESKTVITSVKGRDDLVFRNAHHNVITKKDVFIENEPDVSIDGKAVEKGDILIYKISFTNFDSVPVDIIITDSIPEFTTYVDESADNNGVYSNGNITWTIEDIEPDATVTVSFKVKVTGADVTIENQALVVEGENEFYTNSATNSVKAEEPTPKPEPTPDPEPESSKTGDNVNLNLLFALLFISGGGIIGATIYRLKRKETEEN